MKIKGFKMYTVHIHSIKYVT